MITSKTVIETKDEFLRKAMYEVFGGKYVCTLWMRPTTFGIEIKQNGELIFIDAIVHQKPLKLCLFGYDLHQYFERDGEQFESQMVDVNGDEIDCEVWG